MVYKKLKLHSGLFFYKNFDKCPVLSVLNTTTNLPEKIPSVNIASLKHADPAAKPLFSANQSHNV